jgi:hypothetical protein
MQASIAGEIVEVFELMRHEVGTTDKKCCDSLPSKVSTRQKEFASAIIDWPFRPRPPNQGILRAGLPVLRATIDAGLLVRPFAESVLAIVIGFDVVTTVAASARHEVAAFFKWPAGIAGGE